MPDGLNITNVDLDAASAMIRTLSSEVILLEARATDLEAKLDDLEAKHDLATKYEAETREKEEERRRACYVESAKLCLKALILKLMLDFLKKKKKKEVVVFTLYDLLHGLCLTNWRWLHSKLVDEENRKKFKSIVKDSFFHSLGKALEAHKKKSLGDDNIFKPSFRIVSDADLQAKNILRNKEAHSATKNAFLEVGRHVALLGAADVTALMEFLPENSLA